MLYASHSLVTLATDKAQLRSWIEDGEQAYKQGLKAEKGLTTLLPSSPTCAQSHTFLIGRIGLQKIEGRSSV